MRGALRAHLPALARLPGTDARAGDGRGAHCLPDCTTSAHGRCCSLLPGFCSGLPFFCLSSYPPLDVQGLCSPCVHSEPTLFVVYGWPCKASSAQSEFLLAQLLQIDPAAWIKERQRTRQEPGEAQAQAAARMKAVSSAAGADGKPAAAEPAEPPQQPNGVAAGGAGDEELAGHPPAQGGADSTGIVKAEPKAEPATQPHQAATTAAAATDSDPVSSRSGDAGVDVAADGADAAASQHAAIKQDDDSKPQVDF